MTKKTMTEAEITTLNIVERPGEKKSEVKALRRSDKIPAVIYHKSKSAEPIAVDSLEFTTALRKITPGRLCTTIFTLKDSKGKTRKAIIKDIQYYPVNYKVIHLDFEELIENVPVKVKVPIECINTADCQGIKLGGFLRQVARHIRVSCLPKDIPDCFPVDIKDLVLFDCKRVKDITIPETLKPLANMNDVVLVIAKR